jgi:hypothetical protein
MPGGLWPCGLSGGAPPTPVSVGPVQPCGCFSPLTSGAERPVLYPVLSSAWAQDEPVTKATQAARTQAARAMCGKVVRLIM